MKNFSPFKHYKYLLFVVFLFTSTLIEAVPAKRYQGDQTAIVMREMRDSLDDIRHEVCNHEQEIKTFEEKIRNLENILETFSSQSKEAALAQKESFKDSSATLEGKISTLETTAKSLVSDLKNFKNHANETAQTLAQYKQKLSDLEKIMEMQNQHIENLQTAFKSLTDALQGKPSNNASSGNSYKVVPGDSLEKIARKNQTTIQAIKDINGLTHDRIVVGQTLKMP